MKLTDIQKENIEKWCVELETTDKQQGIGDLCRDNKFCCLGIACELFGAVKTPGIYSDELVCYEKEIKLLPERIRNILGIDRGGTLCTEVIVGSRHIGTLYQLNDSGLFTFPEIARIIREQFLNVD